MHRSHPILHFALLAAIALRMIVGAPCCMDPLSAASNSLAAAAQHDHHAHQGHHAGDAVNQSDTPAPSHGGHEGHGGDNTANPCCSACGPTLPADPVQLAARSAPRNVPEATTVRELATRPPFPAYDARGPPSRV